MGKRRALRSGPGSWLAMGLVLLATLAMVLPFLYMLATALTGEWEAFRYPPALIPTRAHFGNFSAALTALPFDRFFLNSAILATCVVVGQLFTSATAAYAFARLRFPGRDRLFLCFLSVLLVPALVLLVPRFLIVNALGWVDTYAGLISTELVSVWGIFLLRQFFRTIPRELEDAARLDGAGEWTIFRRVVLPLSKPALATLAVVSFVDQWKSFLWPLVIARSTEMQVVEVGLANLHGLYYANWPYQMAAAVTATVPLLLLYLVAQRYFVRGIQMTGVT